MVACARVWSIVPLSGGSSMGMGHLLREMKFVKVWVLTEDQEQHLSLYSSILAHPLKGLPA